MNKCACGCGGSAPIATMTNQKWGHVKGKPVRFIHGHHNRKRLPKLTPIEVAWLAGLLEGEGSFICNVRTRQPQAGTAWRQPSFRIQVGMIDEDIIARVAKMFGTQYWRRKPSIAGCQFLFTTMVSGHRAFQLAALLHEHLGIRRRRQVAQASAAHKRIRAKQPAWPRKLKAAA